MRVQLTTNVRPYSAYRTIVRAMRERRPVFVQYTRENGSHTTRTIEPYAITRNAKGDRYVRVLDWKSGEKRTFRLDRINAYGLGPAFSFRLVDDDEVTLSPDDESAYREWAEAQQRAFVEHASSHPELMGV